MSENITSGNITSRNAADVFIIGKGPAGISASLYTARAGLSTIVTGKDFGALAKAEKIENYFGFAEPVSGEELCKNGIKGAERLGVSVLDDEVFEVSFDGNFTIRTNKGDYEATSVILAAGTSRKAPEIKGVKQYEGMGVSYCAVCDAFFYRDRKAVVIGNGEYAVSEAMHLMPVCSEVTLLTNGRELEAHIDDRIFFCGIQKMQDSSYSFYAESILDLSEDCYGTTGSGAKFRVITGKIDEISGRGTVESVKFEDESVLQTDGVFIAEGTASAVDLARKLGVVDLEGKIMMNPDMSTCVPGFFAAGDCTGGILQVSKAVGDGAAAGMSAVKYIRTKKSEQK